MAETFDDRPDARVPADGPLTAQDLRRVRFSTALRGYRMSEVDALLDRLAAELEPRASDPRPGRTRPEVRVRLQREVDVAAPARPVWDYVTDWPRQEEWIPQTRVERVDDAAGLGGRFRAWTGLGPVGFWDPMTITAWERTADGGGRCEVLHRGAVVKGEGEFARGGPRRAREPVRVGRDGRACPLGRGGCARAGASSARSSSGSSTGGWTDAAAGRGRQARARPGHAEPS